MSNYYAPIPIKLSHTDKDGRTSMEFSILSLRRAAIIKHGFTATLPLILRRLAADRLRISELKTITIKDGTCNGGCF